MPAGTPPGQYTGTVAVKPKDAEATAVPVTLRVWGFEIPEKGSHLKTAFSWDEAGSAAIHGDADDAGPHHQAIDVAHRAPLIAHTAFGR